MHIVVCLDDIGGMMLGNRRVSRDRLLIENLMETVGTQRLLMSAYSAPLFSDYPNANIVVDAEFLAHAQADDVCFVEKDAVLAYADQIQTIILYKWNRRYPATSFFDIPLENWVVGDCVDFVGSSHEKITKAIYTK